MRILTQWVVASIFLMSSISAFASSCFTGGFGDCIWGFDGRNPENNRLMNSTLFLAFCAEHDLHCSSNADGYNAVIGRQLDEEVFILAGPGFGGPDLIFPNKLRAQEFADAFQSEFPNLLFYVKNFNWPARSAVAVGYREKTVGDVVEIKLLFLPNASGSTGANFLYSPPDM